MTVTGRRLLASAILLDSATSRSDSDSASSNREAVLAAATYSGQGFWKPSLATMRHATTLACSSLKARKSCAGPRRSSQAADATNSLPPFKDDIDRVQFG